MVTGNGRFRAKDQWFEEMRLNMYQTNKISILSVYHSETETENEEVWYRSRVTINHLNFLWTTTFVFAMVKQSFNVSEVVLHYHICSIQLLD